jgi:hypothetical protein
MGSKSHIKDFVIVDEKATNAAPKHPNQSTTPPGDWTKKAKTKMAKSTPVANLMK